MIELAHGANEVGDLVVAGFCQPLHSFVEVFTAGEALAWDTEYGAKAGSKQMAVDGGHNRNGILVDLG